MVGSNQWKSGVHYKSKEFIIHESYNKPAYAYDIALVRVQTPIEFSEKVQPIKLSSKVVGAGSNLLVTGWGRLGVNIQFLIVISSQS